MKIAACILIILFLGISFIGADITQTTKDRISELEKEIQTTQQMIEELLADKNVQKNTIYSHIKKLKSLQAQVDEYRNQKYRTELDIDSLKSTIIQNEEYFIENKDILNELVENLAYVHYRSTFIDRNPLNNWMSRGLQLCAHSLLDNLDSLRNFLSQHQDMSKQKQNQLRQLLSNIEYAKSNYNTILTKKEANEQELTFIEQIEVEYRHQISSLKDGITALENFIAQKEAEKYGKEYTFSFHDGIVWPVQGEILQRYGIHKINNTNATIKSEGIYIQTTCGTPVKSIASGVVAFAGWFENIGNLVIIDHQNGFYSLYGFNDKLAVHKEQKIGQSDVIAFSGKNYLMDTDGLYFEIRKLGKAVDPLSYLN